LTEDTLKFLSIPLPEDVMKLKYFGDFDGMRRLIDQLLQAGKLPVALRERLLIEKQIIAVLPAQYPYSFEAALALIQEKIPDFKSDELLALQNNGLVDWFFIQGKPHFQDRFYLNLLKTNKAFADRVNDSEFVKSQQIAQACLDDNVQIMKKNRERTFRIHLKTGIELKDSAIRKNEVLAVHIPIPAKCKQISNIRILSTLKEPKYTAPEDALQRTIYFEEKVSEQNKTFTVEYVYDNHVDYVDLLPEKVWQKQPAFYTHEEGPHIMFTPYVRSLCAEIVGAETNPLLKARKIYDFITTKVHYSFMRSYFTVENIVEYAALNLKGDCGVQALLFITLCRCAGIPAKWQSGMYTAPYTIGNHDWAQFYIAPYGWLFADCSFGGGAYRNNAIERWNYYFGNIDPFRMVANSEFQQCFEPNKHGLRIDPYDNQRGECEYGERGLRSEDFTVIREYIEIKEL